MPRHLADLVALVALAQVINVIVCGLMFGTTGASDCDADGYGPETRTERLRRGYDGYYDYTYSVDACDDSEYLYFWVLWNTIAIMAIWLAPIGYGISSFCAVGSEVGVTVINQTVMAAPFQPATNVQSVSVLRALQSIKTAKELRTQAGSAEP